MHNTHRAKISLLFILILNPIIAALTKKLYEFMVQLFQFNPGSRYYI